MRRRIVATFVVLLAATTALADDCAATKPRFELHAATQNPTITFPKNTMPATITTGAAVKLVVGGGAPIEATVADVTTNAFIGGSIVTLQPSQPLNGPLAGADASGLTAATVTLLPPTGSAIELCGLTPLNYSFHMGPAVSTGSLPSGAADPAGAMRFQLSRGILRLVQVSSDTSLIPAARNLQEELSVSVDTTDRAVKGTPFIDDNRLIAAIRSPEKTFGRVLNRVRVGVEGQFAKAIHTEDRNTDLTIVVDGWLPFVQAMNLFSQTRTRTLPLSFRVSAGRRSQNVTAVRSTGNVADAALIYHLYITRALRRRFRRQDRVQRCQQASGRHTPYAALVQGLDFVQGRSAGQFSAVASYENGHSGPVFTKLRQYFVGIGLQQLFAQSKP